MFQIGNIAVVPSHVNAGSLARSGEANETTTEGQDPYPNPENLILTRDSPRSLQIDLGNISFNNPNSLGRAILVSSHGC